LYRKYKNKQKKAKTNLNKRYACSLFFYTLFGSQNHLKKKMATQEEFESAVERSKTLTERPSNDVLLQLYGLFKQASEGDVNTARPGGFDFKAIAKWDAWKKLEGQSPEAAREAYVQLVNKLKA
jgi:diazepam-binding inhibitor (GABA receptor modulator, acyl-CoA-binding protein)